MELEIIMLNKVSPSQFANAFSPVGEWRTLKCEGDLQIHESRNRMWVIRKGNKWGKNDQKEYYTHI